MKWGGSKSMLYFGVVGRSGTVLGLVGRNICASPVYIIRFLVRNMLLRYTVTVLGRFPRLVGLLASKDTSTPASQIKRREQLGL